MRERERIAATYQAFPKKEKSEIRCRRGDTGNIVFVWRATSPRGERLERNQEGEYACANCRHKGQQ